MRRHLEHLLLAPQHIGRYVVKVQIDILVEMRIGKEVWKWPDDVLEMDGEVLCRVNISIVTLSC